MPQITNKPMALYYLKERLPATSFFLLFFSSFFANKIVSTSMTIIGFDVSKKELVGVRVNKRGDIKDTYILPNTPDAIASFLDSLDTANVTIGSEATGEYHNVLALSCLGHNVPFYVLNPIVTKQFTRATVRKRKTDLSDAHVIAKCLLQGEGELVDISCFEPTKRDVVTNHAARRSALMPTPTSWWC